MQEFPRSLPASVVGDIRPAAAGVGGYQHDEQAVLGRDEDVAVAEPIEYDRLQCADRRVGVGQPPPGRGQRDLVDSGEIAGTSSATRGDSPPRSTSSPPRSARSPSSWPHALIAIWSCGPLTAAKSSVRPPGVHRFKSKDTYARHNGTVPLPVWSSNRARHRLSRTGNRQLNAALHRVALT